MSTAEKLQNIEVIKVRRKKMESIAMPNIKEQLRFLLENLIKELVPYPEDIQVSYSCGEKTTIYKVECSQRVLGHIIGSRGKNIQSVRTIVQGISARKGFRSIVEIPYFDHNPSQP